MKDSEFIELLNLYLDHEISVVDAARLEAEVQNNAARRQVYQQYCRIQKACKLLTTDFQPSVASAPEAAKKVVPFVGTTAAAKRRPRAGQFYATGALAAAAACVAIIFVGRSHEAAADAEAAAIAASSPQQVAPAAIMAAADAGSTAPSAADRPTLVAVAPTPNLPRALGSARTAAMMADPLLLTGNAQADAALAAAMEQAEAQFAWMRNVQLAPIQSNRSLVELRFEAKPNSLRPEGRTLGNRSHPSASGDVQLAAFQFVK